MLADFVRYLFLIALFGGCGYLVYQHPDLLEKLQLSNVASAVAPVTLEKTAPAEPKISRVASFVPPLNVPVTPAPGTGSSTPAPNSTSPSPAGTPAPAVPGFTPAPASSPAPSTPTAATPAAPAPVVLTTEQREEKRRAAQARKEATLKNPPYEIVTKSGRIYSRIKISSVLPDGVMIKHDQGGCRVLFSEMTSDLQLAFGYDKDEAAAQQREKAAAASAAGTPTSAR